MNRDQQAGKLQLQVDELSAERTALREDGFRGSKAEALMALEYDRIPNVLKTPRAIIIQRRVATAVMIIVPLLLLAIAVGGGINAYRDHQRSKEMTANLDRLDEAFRIDPAFRLRK